ncbi:tyrosine-type recombinase/integrase [Acinetobacter sp. CUI P1]|nr:tyrosine-type recombinase/integrase [Acinetobacter sp. CUI P1]
MAGSVRKDGNSWYYVLETKVNGKRKQVKKRGFKTKREADKALTGAENAVNQGTYIQPSKLSYGLYITDWMNNRKHNLSNQTFSMMNLNIHKHILPSLGDILLTEIRATTIARFISELREKGLADSTVKRIYSIVNTSLHDAEKLELINKNYAGIVEKPKVQRKDITVWSVEEVTRFLDVGRLDRLYIAFHLAITTGMRQGEILGLRWQDVDFNNGVISVRQTLSHDGKILVAGAKTASSVRTIAIDPQTVEVLRKQRMFIYKEKLSLGAQYKDYDLVVCTALGTPVSPRNLMRTYYRIIEQNELNHITFHDLRHTHASLMLRQNIHPKVVSERLGHSKIQITLDTYSHLMPNMQQDAANEIGNLLFKTNYNS